MDNGGGIELNLVSNSSVVSQPSTSRTKKRSGKAWDKKKKRGVNVNSAKQGSASQEHQHDGTKDNVPRAQAHSPSPNEEKRGTAVERSSREPDVINRTVSVRNSSAPSMASPASTPNATPGFSHNDKKNRTTISTLPGRKPRRDTAMEGGDHGKSGRSPGEVSTERRRVLEMAGRSSTPKATASPSTSGNKREQSDNGGGGSSTKRALPSSEASSPTARATKRKRPGGNGGKGPVTANGVIDFTAGENARTPKKSDPEKNRKAAATAAAVAKATAAMARAGAKWWDDDDDDHVVSAAANAKTMGAAAPASSITKSKWKKSYENGDGHGDSMGDAAEKEEDKDGGLPSDVHPNSVRTKAVDMDGEATNAMGILAALLEKGGDGVAGGEESRRGKNGGKSKKKARESTRLSPADQKGGGDGAQREATREEEEAKATDVVTEMDVEKTDGEDTPAKQVSENDEESLAQGATAAGGGAIARAVPGGAAAAAATSVESGIGTYTSRKTRGKLNSSTGIGDSVITSDSSPAPEYHARPRELSRRAAARPLASTPSGHVMAAGPGATFSAVGLPPKMVSHLEEPKGDLGGGGMGLAGPTVCQLASMPVLSAGHNTVIKSETGSGKTLAYLLPMLCDLAAMDPRVDREKGTLAIVLAPTRELSAQILDVLSRVVRPFIWLVPGSISGGERRKSEKARLRKGVTILVCTPGRLLDHLKTTKCFRRDLLKWLILDEADRLLDLGFEKQIKEIVELLDQSARAVRSGPAGGSRVQGGAVVPSIKVIKRQTVLVSATLDKGVSRLAAVLLSKHMRVDTDANFVESVDESGKAKLISGERGVSSSKKSTGTNDSTQLGERNGKNGASNPSEEFSTPRQLVQYYMTVTQKLRLPALCSFLRARSKDKVVVFMSTCDAVDFHQNLFSRARWPGDTPAPSAEDITGGGDQSGEKQGAKTPAGNKAKAAVPDTEFFGTGCVVRRLHGNVPQVERQATYRAFGAAKSGVLICTDVAARGLDLPTVDWIVQYDPPAETADYVHRVGRTARKGERGHSLLFLLPRESEYLGVLEGRGLRPKPLSLEGVLCAADAGKRDARRADEQLAYELQQGLQLLVAGDKPLLDRARAAFQSHVRAYAARAPDSRAVFQVRSLHLGHVARSFALKDPPTAVKVGKRVVRRPGDAKGRGNGEEGRADGGAMSARGEKRRRDGAGGTGGSVRRLGLSKQTEMNSRAEFL